MAGTDAFVYILALYVLFLASHLATDLLYHQASCASDVCCFNPPQQY